MKTHRKAVLSGGPVFVRCATERLAHVARNGLDVRPEDVFVSLRTVRRAPDEALLVAMPGHGLLFEGQHLAPADFLNLEPYRAPKLVTAAGGVLVREVGDEKQVLLIFRRGVWDLPKGKQDRGETIAACARREVNEELGISDARIVHPIARTRHGYADARRYAVKTTHWFLMRSEAERFVPQAAEQIEAVAWFRPRDAVRHLAYEALRNLLTDHAPLFGLAEPA